MLCRKLANVGLRIRIMRSGYDEKRFGEKTKRGKFRGYRNWDRNVLWMESGTVGTNSVDH